MEGVTAEWGNGSGGHPPVGPRSRLGERAPYRPRLILLLWVAVLPWPFAPAAAAQEVPPEFHHLLGPLQVAGAQVEAVAVTLRLFVRMGDGDHVDGLGALWSWDARYNHVQSFMIARLGGGGAWSYYFVPRTPAGSGLERPTIEGLTGGGRHTAHDGCGHIWSVEWEGLRMDEVPTLRITGEGETVRLWYFVPELSMVDPGGPTGRGRCYVPEQTEPPYRKENWFLYQALLDAGAVMDDTGHFLLAELGWEELLAGTAVRERGISVGQLWEADFPSEAVLSMGGTLEPRQRVAVEGPARTVESLDSEPFRVRVLPQDREAEAYRWEARDVETAGNRAEAVFEAPDARETRILRAHWFAFPDSRWVAETGMEAVWDVRAFATLDGVEHASPVHRWRVGVQKTGRMEPPPFFTGRRTVQIEQGEDERWYVTGPGDFRRLTELEIEVDAPRGSQFRAKVEAHERHHQRQYLELEPGRSLWDAETFFRETLMNLPSQPNAWQQQLAVSRAIREWSVADQATYDALTCPHELEAFEAEFGVEPPYLEWQASDVVERYGCTFPDAADDGGGEP
jgi:hypothetical protein